MLDVEHQCSIRYVVRPSGSSMNVDIPPSGRRICIVRWVVVYSGTQVVLVVERCSWPTNICNRTSVLRARMFDGICLSATTITYCLHASALCDYGSLKFDVPWTLEMLDSMFSRLDG